MPLEIHYPFKPFEITQVWGNPNTAYEQFGFELHNGVDARPWYSDAQLRSYYPVYCPVDGFTVWKVDYQPNGGGNEVWLISDNEYQMFDKKCRALLVLCHGKKVLVKAGDKLSVGDLLMIGDNTGFSTGTHTHIGLYRVDYNGAMMHDLDTNGASDSFDPSLFFTKKFAVDVASYTTLFKASMRYYTYVSTGL